ncbi:hypothetical protein JHN63_02130 [Streptomyces sp. MBT65]|uniref:hypothetical protein n=1 Tax=Streptomyces sp. MBT65 TaxID=1488395 RepID=UPI00190B2CF9|nr:hypothetical protein [Streptomyces sp. MBT65]MBK3572640.1 hypothetical protein [Streptomyces sp. MBT65]
MTSAYTKAYQALTRGHVLRPDEAAELLADLRAETATELTDAVFEQLVTDSQATSTDTEAAIRRKRRAFGAGTKTLRAIRQTAASTPTTPGPSGPASPYGPA